MTQLTIQKISTIDQQISIIFQQSWFQEDIDDLSQLVLSKIPHYTVREKNFGADREDLRFTWQENEFVLNFEYYSQSCWISACDEKSQKTIPTLNDELVINVSNNV